MRRLLPVRPNRLPLTALLVLLLPLATVGPTRGADDAPPEPAWVTYPGGPGVGAGRTIVLVSGDEEYRSEEALPQLGKILSVRHGFRCHVLFAVDPDTGAIDPDVRTNIPGLATLADADLMIIATRFRDLPDRQMAWIDGYLRSGRPVVGLRTATHAFALESSPTYAQYSWNHADPAFAQGFGRQVLGETWISHHGAHGSESTRGVVAPGMADHPIVRGLAPGSVWGPTDVYGVRLPLPDGCSPVVLGAVLAGMTPDAPPVAGAKNAPRLPIAWTRTDAPGGPRRVFTTTMGAATDLRAEGTRRMIVQGALWAMGLGDRIPARGVDVGLVGTYEPTDFGFGGARTGVRPAAHALPAPATPAPNAGARLHPGDRIVVTGGTLAERLARSGVFDALVHAARPDHRLRIRHVPWSGDTAGLRPREMNVPTTADWIERLDADLVLLCFGGNEALDASARETFEDDLRGLVAAVRARTGADGRPPRPVLVSPIAPEDTGAPWPDAATLDAHDAALAEVTATMRRVAETERIPFVDLFTASRAAYAAHARPLTDNGIHPNERGCAVLAEAIARGLGWLDDLPAAPADAAAASAAADALRTLACDKHWLFRLRYRPTNTEYVWGRRHAPYGVVNFPPELDQLDRMVAARERAMHDGAKPPPAAVVAHALASAPARPRTPSRRTFPEDDWTPVTVVAKGTETSLGALAIADPDAFAESFTLPDDYVVECFASEQDFPALANPLAMAFDARGRLWVLCTPTYPHLLPGQRPRCRLLILADTDGDGRADTSTVFADELYIPTGFAIDADAVYVGQAPDLLRLRDTDGDDRADVTEIVASGFGMCDSHHNISAFEWDPTGGLLMHEGVFTVSNVETPTGVRRTRGAGVWRYDPRTGDLRVLAHCYFNNPWGHVFDDYGASILADASGGDNFSFPHMALPYVYPAKPKQAPRVSHRGRPTAGCELIASRHFPDDVQDSFLVNQSIGFHGTRWDRMRPSGSTWAAQPMPQDLLASTDVNFRPVAMEIGPDGALYVVDWCNPIIGHMQYSVRDPRRDHAHGRVWRIRHATRPLVTPPDVADASLSALLDLLRLPERNTRAIARRRLQRAAWPAVRAALAAWNATLDPADPLYDRLVLEDLWIRHAHGRAGADLFDRALRLREPRARAGAVRVLRHALQAEAMAPSVARPFLARAVEDDDMRVRLEGVVACGFLPPADGVDLAARADLREMDDAMAVVFGEVLAHLGRDGTVASEVLERVRLERLPADELLARPLDDVVARVRVLRPDLDRADRLAALAHLAGDDPAAQAARLAALLDTARGAETLRAAGRLLLALPGPAVATLSDAAHALSAHASPERRAIGVAVMLRVDPARAPADPATRVAALALLEDGTAPGPALARLRDDVTAGAVDPAPAVVELVRHAGADPATRPWLEALVAPVDGAGLEPWTPAHERAMAGLRGLALGPAGTGEPRYRIEPAPPERFARGSALYEDETTGCARCHGRRGQGLEGFPPLDRSPRVLGDARRAAGIVVHGLYGRLETAHGVVDSVMAPLGDTMTDGEIADVLTFVRQSWGNYAPAVDAATVAAARADVPPGGAAWAVSALRTARPASLDTLVPAPPAVTASWPAVVVRQVVVYLVPPLVAIALIWSLLAWRDRASAARA